MSVTSTRLSRPFDSQFAQVEKTVHLASLIVRTLNNDETIKTEALYISEFLLFFKKIPLDICEELVTSPQAAKILDQLIRNGSPFLNFDSKPFGVDIVAKLGSPAMQQALNVKHTKKSEGSESNRESSGRIIPDIRSKSKIYMLYSHDQQVWIRFRSLKTDFSEMLNFHQSARVFNVKDHIWELYFPKNKDKVKLKRDLEYFASGLEKSYDADLIFVSELPFFFGKADPVFLSNTVKFYWCYFTNREDFELKTFSDWEQFSNSFSMALLFLKTTNLNTPSDMTHAPIAAMMGEKPGRNLRTSCKKNPGKMYEATGSRSMAALGLPSDIGSDPSTVIITGEFSLL